MAKYGVYMASVVITGCPGKAAEDVDIRGGKHRLSYRVSLNPVPILSESVEALIRQEVGGSGKSSPCNAAFTGLAVCVAQLENMHVQCFALHRDTC